MQSEGRPPRREVAAEGDTGRACPYCRFPLKEGVAVARCGVCGAAHHADCWQDNDGCAVIGCTGGPVASGGQGASAGAGAAAEPGAMPTQPHVVPARQAPAPPPPVPPPGWQPQEPARRSSRGPSLTVAVLVLALAIGGGAAAIVLGQQSKTPVQLVGNRGTASGSARDATPQSGTEVEDGSSTSTPESANTPEDTQSEGTAESPADSNAPAATQPELEGQLPREAPEQMRSDIQHMLLEWHEDVVSGNYQAAWNLLSQRKQEQSSHKYGYAGWVKNQETLNPYLDPSGLNVAVLSTTPSNGVATVRITGMRWNKPGARCSEWSGITWVKYEDDAWRYDPGYSTSPQREAEWKSRFSELLGGQC